MKWADQRTMRYNITLFVMNYADCLLHVPISTEQELLTRAADWHLVSLWEMTQSAYSSQAPLII